MKASRVLSLLALVLGLGAALPAAEPAPPPAAKGEGMLIEATLPGGQKVVLPDRERMRAKPGTRSLVVPRHLKAAMATVPTPPAAFDWSRNGTIAMPILGNDRWGCCYYAAMAHHAQLWKGMNGTPLAFDTNTLVARYKVLSRGDNGLSDSDVFGPAHNGEFYGGIIGPKGPNRILDHMVIRPDDPGAIALAQHSFGGTLFTFVVPSAWINNAHPGAVWDKATPGQGGHATLLSGRNADGTWNVETWGIRPQIKVTQRGLEGADPEVITCFSLDWFDPTTQKAPNGMTYTECASLWQTLGGRSLPVAPFGPPAPVPVPPVPVPPVPVPPTPAPPVPVAGKFSGTLTYQDGVLVAVTPNGKAPLGAEEELKAAGVNPAVIADVLQLLGDLKDKKGPTVVMADLLRIMADLK